MKTTTYRPKTKKRSRKHGFLKRSQSQNGRNTIKRRRRRGRKNITV